jgi:hypothetical protein
VESFRPPNIPEKKLHFCRPQAMSNKRAHCSFVTVTKVGVLRDSYNLFFNTV